MRHEGEQFTSTETETKHLIYANEFRAALKEHPGIIRRATEMMDQAVAEYDPPPIRVHENLEVRWNKDEQIWQEFWGDSEKPHKLLFGRGMFFSPSEHRADEVSGIELTLLGVSRRHQEIGMFGDRVRRDHTDYFKATLDGQSFFIKRSLITPTPGFHEFQNTLRAKEILADLDYVKVIEPQLGYHDQQQSWYVSKWEDIERAGFAVYFDAEFGSLNEYGEHGDSIFHPLEGDEAYLNIYSPRFQRIEAKYKIIEERLESAGLAADLQMNLFVNPKTETFILLDVTSAEGTSIGQPIINRDQK